MNVALFFHNTLRSPPALCGPSVTIRWCGLPRGVSAPPARVTQFYDPLQSDPDPQLNKPGQTNPARIPETRAAEVRIERVEPVRVERVEELPVRLEPHRFRHSSLLTTEK